MAPNASVLTNADVWTLGDPGRSTRAPALAWRGDEIIAVGTVEEVTRAAGPDAALIDVAGASVLPGFIDAHHHASLAALWGGALRMRPPKIRSISDIQQAIADEARAAEPGQWVFVTEWDEALLDERRAPTRRELDDACPDRPVLAMHYSCHRAVANSRALELAGIGKSTPDPPGGWIERGAGGVPTGLLIERGMSRAESLVRADRVARDAEGFFTRLAAHHRALLEVGITTLADATVPLDLLTLYREAARRGSMIVPTIAFPVSVRGYFEAPLDVIDQGPIEETTGPLSVGPVKLVFDGAPACAMCLSWWQLAGVAVGTWALSLRQRSLDPLRTTMSVKPRLGATVRTGIQIYRREEARDVVRRAAERGVALAVHAFGNEAVDIALAAFERAGSGIHRGGIPRLEHAAFVDRELVARAAGIGAAVVTQPHFLTLPAASSATSIPGLKHAALRWFLDAGVKLAGSSDYPVAGFDPLDGIRGAVTRRTSKGHAYEPDQAIELDEAVSMYTRGAAEVCGILDRCGTLAPGKRANIVVLDRALSRSSLAEARVRATILGGEVQAGQLPRNGE